MEFFWKFCFSQKVGFFSYFCIFLCCLQFCVINIFSRLDIFEIWIIKPTTRHCWKIVLYCYRKKSSKFQLDRMTRIGLIRPSKIRRSMHVIIENLIKRSSRYSFWANLMQSTYKWGMKGQKYGLKFLEHFCLSRFCHRYECWKKNKVTNHKLHPIIVQWNIFAFADPATFMLECNRKNSYLYKRHWF